MGDLEYKYLFDMEAKVRGGFIIGKEEKGEEEERRRRSVRRVFFKFSEL